MHGLAELEHDVVGHVYGRADSAHASTAQPFYHPARRDGRRVQVFQYPPEEPRTGLWCPERYRESIGMDRSHSRRLMRAQRLVEQHGDFARHTTHRKRIATVRREIQFQDHIVQVQRFAEALTGSQRGWQLHQTGALGGQAEFRSTAKHAVAVDAA